MTSLFQGLHHVSVIHLEKINCSDPYCISMPTFFPLVTFDDNKLTNLVLLAHDYIVRVEIRPSIFIILQFNFIKDKEMEICIPDILN